MFWFTLAIGSIIACSMSLCGTFPINSNAGIISGVAILGSPLGFRGSPTPAGIQITPETGPTNTPTPTLTPTPTP